MSIFYPVINGMFEIMHIGRMDDIDMDGFH